MALFQTIIFSIGITRMPSAPDSRNRSMRSQKSFSSTTECRELQPSRLSGMIVGLFIPGMIRVIRSIASFGQLRRMYLLFFAFITAVMRRSDERRVGKEGERGRSELEWRERKP